MNEHLAIELEEKISLLQASIRTMGEEKISMEAQIALLQKEKEILLNALTHFTSMEETLSQLKDRNVVLEGQLTSLIHAIEKIESDSK